jgi:ubiquinone/menaquinone biosynthesis C-methylase UbiE
MDYTEKSYHKQKEEFADNSEERKKVYQSWFDTTSIDYWRHARMIEPIAPLLKLNPTAKWVTIGDGRFGLDSIKLKDIEPKISVLPTDISPYLLEQSKNEGHIINFSVENAETLSFDDNAFDYAFCKEAYHHFPRPYIAVYEMLRVSKKAIIFIEPNDHTFNSVYQSLIINIKHFIKDLLKKKHYHPDTTKFEPSGNYIYTVSKREIEKIALGLNLTCIAYSYYNDYYEKGLEFKKINTPDFERVKKNIAKIDFKSKLGFTNFAGIRTIIFKTNPTAEERKQLQEKGFTIVDLPVNPFA